MITFYLFFRFGGTLAGVSIILSSTFLQGGGGGGGGVCTFWGHGHRPPNILFLGALWVALRRIIIFGRVPHFVSAASLIVWFPGSPEATRMILLQ